MRLTSKEAPCSGNPRQSKSLGINKKGHLKKLFVVQGHKPILQDTTNEKEKIAGVSFPLTETLIMNIDKKIGFSHLYFFLLTKKEDFT